MRPGIKMIVIGGSAGSLDVVLKILPELYSTMNVPLVIILHRKQTNDSLLVDLLRSKTGLLVKEADEKEKLLPDVIYVAPADYHLLIENDHSFSLDASEKVNYSRPSIDVTFESAASVYKDTLVGILLSGANADGVNGLKKIKEMGGITVVQDPASAGVPYMPMQALKAMDVDLVFSGNDVTPLIQKFRDFNSTRN